MKILFLLLALSSSGWVAAETDDARLERLEAAYNRIHQEQQTIFQQFQMVLELRRKELESPPSTLLQRYPTMGELDYDENVRRQQAYQERLQRYDQDISRAYTRYLELSSQKRQLLEQMQGPQPPEPGTRR